MSEHRETIIIVKKKRHHDGHHGGAWKVAYADFVTAMMALFIVLWLLSSDEKVKKAVGGYFQDPTGKGTKIGTTQAGVGEALPIRAADMSRIKDKIEAALREMTEFEHIKKHVMVTVTPEGLRIELLEDDDGLFFQSGNAQPSDSGQKLLTMLAQELGKLPNRIYLEGHTDSRPFAGGGAYSNWELSADRANAARRLMQNHGIRLDQVGQVRGFADQHLRRSDAPDHASNRRVSIIVGYNELKTPKENPEAPSEKAPADGHGADPKSVAAHPPAKSH